MKRLKSIIKYAIIVIALLQIPMVIHAASPEEQTAADMLYALGLFRGTDNGYELDKNLTRAEAVTMIVRFLGEENAAIQNADINQHPFVDVPAWAQPYVGYAYVNNITKGVSANAFDSNAPVTPQQFLTFMLRVLHYSDSNGDFSWDKPENLAIKVGLTKELYFNEFLRGNMVLVCKNALSAVYKDDVIPVWQELCRKQVFTEELYNNLISKAETGDSSDTTGKRSGSGRSSRSSKKNEDQTESTAEPGKAVLSEGIKPAGNNNVFTIAATTSGDGRIIDLVVSLEGDVDLCGFDLALYYDSKLCKLKDWNAEYDLQVVGDANETEGVLAFNYAGVKNITSTKKILTASFEVIGVPKTQGAFSLRATEVIRTDNSNNYDIVDAVYALTSVSYTIE